MNYDLTQVLTETIETGIKVDIKRSPNTTLAKPTDLLPLDTPVVSVTVLNPQNYFRHTTKVNQAKRESF